MVLCVTQNLYVCLSAFVTQICGMCWLNRENCIVIENWRCKKDMIHVNFLTTHHIIISFAWINIYKCARVYNWSLRMDIVNIGFIFMGLNTTYVMYNSYCTIFNISIPLIHHFISSNGSLYGLSYLYISLFLRVALSPNFSRILLLVYVCGCTWFSWSINY